MNAQQLLDSLASTMGLPPMPLNSDHCARIVFDGKVEVDFEGDPESGELFLHCSVGALPRLGREDLYRRLLEANLFGQQTSRSTFAIDAGTESVVLWRADLCEELSLIAFQQIVEDFVNCAETWMSAVEQAGHGDSSEPLAGTSGETPFPGMGTQQWA
jgi:hypothetical protein